MTEPRVTPANSPEAAEAKERLQRAVGDGYLSVAAVNGNTATPRRADRPGSHSIVKRPWAPPPPLPAPLTLT
ncbi:MAG: hypothetical protein WD825_10190 [Gemmatimonadaceae bacterium]